jgi:putative peptidoglycan lipid II flippase
MQSTPWQRAGWLALLIGAGGAAYFMVLAVLGFRPRDFRHHA